MIEDDDNTQKIQNLVQTFADGLSPQCSAVWIEDLVSRLGELPKEGRLIELDDVQAVHEEKIVRMCATCMSMLRKRHDLDHERLNYIVFGAYGKWLLTFDPKKARQAKDPELNFLFLLSSQAADTLRIRERPEIGMKYALKSSGGQPVRATHVEIDEALQMADEKAQEAIERAVFGDSEAEAEAEADLADEFQLVTFKVSGATGNPPAGDVEKRVAFVAAKEILRYYSLTKRVNVPTNRRSLPSLIGQLKHNLISFIHFHQDVQNLNLDLTLLDAGDVTGYYKMRHHVLSHAGTRRWMELAIAKLRESKAQKLRTLTTGDLSSEAIRELEKVPILGAVVVQADGAVVTWFRGQAHDQSLPKDHIDLWKKHCECSLFSDVIGKENLRLLRGGTLFVTLEPCNFGSFTDGAESKIPCAVCCLEAELKQIYIGSFDYNRSVRGSSIKMLETGIYEFHFENGAYKSKSPSGGEGAAQLEKYFKSKYELLADSSENCHRYRIGKPIEVAFFDVDLMLEIYDLNAQFQHGKKSGTYDFGIF